MLLVKMVSHPHNRFDKPGLEQSINSALTEIQQNGGKITNINYSFAAGYFTSAFIEYEIDK